MKTLHYQSKYSDCLIYLDMGKYSNGRIAIQLIDADDGCLVTKATINIPDVVLADNELIIKDYSENEGMLHFLTSTGLTTEPKRYVSSGHVECPVVEYLSKLMEYCQS